MAFYADLPITIFGPGDHPKSLTQALSGKEPETKALRRALFMESESGSPLFGSKVETTLREIATVMERRGGLEKCYPYVEIQIAGSQALCSFIARSLKNHANARMAKAVSLL